MIRITTDAEGIISINGLTFLQFSNELKGKIIINKRGYKVPKYLLFWRGLSPIQIYEHFVLINRE